MIQRLARRLRRPGSILITLIILHLFQTLKQRDGKELEEREREKNSKTNKTKSRWMMIIGSAEAGANVNVRRVSRELAGSSGSPARLRLRLDLIQKTRRPGRRPDEESGP